MISKMEKYIKLHEQAQMGVRPVQQVDLTDGEIAKALGFNIMLVTTTELKNARAVIAAYREKNK